MSVAHAGHSATLLADGRVLITGGDTSGSAESFDPSSGTFSAINVQMNSARSKHSAALLPDGRVLLVGGQSGDGLAGLTAESFNPAGSSFSTVDSPLMVVDTRALGLVTNNCYRLDVYVGSITGPTAIKLSTSVWAIFKPTK